MDAYRRKRNIAWVAFAMVCVSVGAFAWRGRRPADTGSYPKLVNYYLTHAISEDEAKELAKWDAVILGPEVAVNSPSELALVRRLKPDIVLLAYFEAVSRTTEPPPATHGRDPRLERFRIADSAWLLKTVAGGRVSIWPKTEVLNPTAGAPLVQGERWQDAFPKYVARVYREEPLWDGVFIDNALEDISWAGEHIDIDADAEADTPEEVDNTWKRGVTAILRQLRERLGERAIIVNNSSSLGRRFTNGRMYENAFADRDAWQKEFDKIAGVSKRYARQPRLVFINANTGNTGDRSNMQKFRLAYASALLAGAYFNYDRGDEWHQQTWWYDEYEHDLGMPLREARQAQGEEGVWQRDFQKGFIVVNGTSVEKVIANHLLAPHDAMMVRYRS